MYSYSFLCMILMYLCSSLFPILGRSAYGATLWIISVLAFFFTLCFGGLWGPQTCRSHCHCLHSVRVAFQGLFKPEYWSYVSTLLVPYNKEERFTGFDIRLESCLGRIPRWYGDSSSGESASRLLLLVDQGGLHARAKSCTKSSSFMILIGTRRLLNTVD